MERLMALLDVDVDVVAFMQVREVVGCNTEKSFAVALEGLYIEDTPCESAGSNFSEGRG